MKIRFLQLVVVMAIAAGCKQRKADSGEFLAKDCELHHTELFRVSGYFPNKDFLVDPTIEYGMFMSEFRSRYPHMTPWMLQKKASEDWEEKQTVEACSECDRTYKEDYAAYLKLDQAERERRWDAYLSRASQKDTVPVAPSSGSSNGEYSPKNGGLPPLPDL